MSNFNCAFPECDYKRNDIEEKEFLKHLKEEHYDEILEVAKKDNMSVETVEMMTVSNSKVFINY
ncbi:MAG: hypothetical protein K5777_03765 [Nitrosopumilus sp.]|nr:hypothetical protein [Nitrosopumilus sp.]